MTRVREQVALDLLASDLLPACPGCGDLAHPGATVCEMCGTHLLVRKPALPPRAQPDDRPEPPDPGDPFRDDTAFDDYRRRWEGDDGWDLVDA